MDKKTRKATLSITGVEISNVMKIKYVKIEPKGSLTIIGGKNGHGKTSLLTAIASALGGKRLCPTDPIRSNEPAGSVSIDLEGDDERLPTPCTVKRTWVRNEDGTISDEMAITSKEGFHAPTPQGILNEVLRRSSFDPLAFSRMDDGQQAATLRDLVGVDTRKLDTQRQGMYLGRAAKNKELKAAKHHYEVMPLHDVEEVDVSGVFKQIQVGEETNRQNAASRRWMESLDATNAAYLAGIAKRKTELEKLRKEIEKAENIHAEQLAIAAKERDAVESLKDTDVGPLKKKITDAKAINAKVAANVSKATAWALCERLRIESDDMTDKIKDIDATKSKLLDGVKWPIDGLSFDDDTGTVVFNSHPFSQASQAEAIQISTAIGLALNPRLKILLIKEAALLDEEHLCEIAKMAAVSGGQVFAERVGEGAECHVIMRDGEDVKTKIESTSKEHVIA